MILDKIENIDIYTNINSEIRDFIKDLSGDITLGRYELSNGAYVNVETYTTKTEAQGKFESHKNFIDIQLLLEGEEIIYFEDIEYLTSKTGYNIEKDIIFYDENISNGLKYKLDGTNFAIIYPHEGHAPQICFNQNRQVKKVVVKVPV